METCLDGRGAKLPTCCKGSQGEPCGHVRWTPFPPPNPAPGLPGWGRMTGLPPRATSWVLPLPGSPFTWKVNSTNTELILSYSPHFLEGSSGPTHLPQLPDPSPPPCLCTNSFHCLNTQCLLFPREILFTDQNPVQLFISSCNLCDSEARFSFSTSLYWPLSVLFLVSFRCMAGEI